MGPATFLVSFVRLCLTCVCSRVESWACVDEDCITRMSTASLEGIAEMQQIFQKLSITHDPSPSISARVPNSQELHSSEWKPYKVHDSVGTVQDA